MTTQQPVEVPNITPDQLREMIKGRAENEFKLVDVRQPEEYTEEHIPGAELFPLMEVEASPERFEPAELNIFYCRSGGRSMRAATHVVRTRGIQNVYNLDGGMLGWNGEKLPDVPNLRAFSPDGTMEEIVRKALDLEKGAHRLYARFLDRFRGTALESDLKPLAQAEVGHARSLYSVLNRLTADELPPFPEMFDSLSGRLLESGQTLDDLAAKVDALEFGGTAAVLELALELEFRAYDLYRNAAQRAKRDDSRELLLEMAAEEKKHARAVVRSFGKMAAERSSKRSDERAS